MIEAERCEISRQVEALLDLGVGERPEQCLGGGVVGRGVDGFGEAPALVGLVQNDGAVGIRELDVGDGVLVDAEELLLLPLLLGLRDLVEVEVRAERRHQEGRDADASGVHAVLRRHHTAMPNAISSSGRISTER